MSTIFCIVVSILAILAINANVLDNYNYPKTNITITKVKVGSSNGKFTLWTNASGTEFLVVTNPVMSDDNIFPLMHDLHTIDPGKEDVCSIVSLFNEQPGFIFPTIVKMLGISSSSCPITIGEYPIKKSAVYRLPMGVLPHCRGEMGKVYFISFKKHSVKIMLVVKVHIKKLHDHDPCKNITKYNTTKIL